MNFLMEAKSRTYLRFIILLLSGAMVLLFSASSVLSLYVNRATIKGGIASIVGDESTPPAEPQVIAEDKFWANEVLGGGYILHFRHAEREKWLDVQMYDLLESKIQIEGKNKTAYGENQYYKKAVCLNSRGLVQAKAMGQIFKNLRLPINSVVSSPSCRARQTAELAFGGYSKLDLRLLHEGVFYESKKRFIDNLRSLYKSLEVKTDKNVIVMAHNSVINPEMFTNGSKFKKEFFNLEEGGFYVISKAPSGLKLEHKFTNFRNFTKVIFTK
jgi:phosphohistidine phosphatase SixA